MKQHLLVVSIPSKTVLQSSCSQAELTAAVHHAVTHLCKPSQERSTARDAPHHHQQALYQVNMLHTNVSLSNILQ